VASTAPDPPVADLLSAAKGNCDPQVTCSTRRGRLPLSASREQRNLIFRFLRQRVPVTLLLSALRGAFSKVPRSDLKDNLEPLPLGTVWAADFKERRKPIEGRYGWILAAVKDLASRCNWLGSPWKQPMQIL
jgi:hypothetical protein